MADHTAAGLRTAIKSLKDVVAPAIDQANPLAGEQLRMVCAYLALVAEQLPHRAARIRFELRSATRLADSLVPLAVACPARAREALDAALATARRLQAAVDADELEIEHATSGLNAAISTIVRTAGAADDAARREIERAVVFDSKALLDAHRTWYAPLGFESKSEQLPSLAAALAAAR